MDHKVMTLARVKRSTESNIALSLHNYVRHRPAVLSMYDNDIVSDGRPGSSIVVRATGGVVTRAIVSAPHCLPTIVPSSNKTAVKS